MSRENYRKIKILIRNEPKLVTGTCAVVSTNASLAAWWAAGTLSYLFFLAPCENLLYGFERTRLEAVLDAERNPSVGTRLPLKNSDHPRRGSEMSACAE